MQGRRADEQLGGSESKAGWTDWQGGWKGGERRQGRWASRAHQLGGEAGRRAEKLGRTHKKATGGKERHGLCSLVKHGTASSQGTAGKPGKVGMHGRHDTKVVRLASRQDRVGQLAS